MENTKESVSTVSIGSRPPSQQNENGISTEREAEPSPPWKELMHDYTQDTTMHGIRYVTLATRYFIRRLVWVCIMLGATALFIYVMQFKLRYLISKPKNVDVEVTYRDKLDFPTVTFCNENKYRMTSLFENGLYDLMVNRRKPGYGSNIYTELPSGCTKDEYNYQPDVCEMPPEFWGKQDGERRTTIILNDVTRGTCMELCSSNTFSLYCSGIMYDRRTLSCTITPYTGDYLVQNNSCSGKEKEFYRRLRCLSSPDIICNFEDRMCSFINDPPNEKGDQWRIITGEDTNEQIIRDNTLDRKSGHSLALSATKKRAGYTARYSSPYIRTTDRCLTFFYRGAGTKSADLMVSVRNEERETTVLFQLREPAKRNDWSRVHVKLPAGIHQILLVSKRSLEDVTSGLLVDDMTVSKCNDPENSCMRTRLGKDYVGNINMTTSGHECAMWSSVDILGNARFDLPEARLSGADPFRDSHNYCRNIPGLGWTEPMCYTVLQQQKPTACGIPTCSCPDYDWFTCKNNFCIPENKLCDGKDDCQDWSDEICELKTAVSCKFEEPYVCGYVFVDRLDYLPTWVRHKGKGFSAVTSPTGDHEASLSGFYMLIDSRQFGAGRIVRAASPLHTFSGRSHLTFYLHMFIMHTDANAKLTFHLRDRDDQDVMVLFSRAAREGRRGSREWTKEKTVQIPAGSYRILVEAVTGKSMSSDIAVDEVKLVETTDAILVMEPEHALTEINCHPNTGGCEHVRSIVSNSLFFKWSVDFSSVILVEEEHHDVCGQLTYTSASGRIHSPYYPNKNYSIDLHCEYTIKVPLGMRILIQFHKNFDIEYNRYCNNDYVQYHDIIPSKNKSSDQFCGWSAPDDYISFGNVVKVVFASDFSVTGKGFALNYRAIGHSKLAYFATYGTASATVGETFFTRLATAPLYMNTTYCLEAELLVNRHFEILLVHAIDHIWDSAVKESVFVVEEGLGLKWHQIKYFIKPPETDVKDDTFRLEFVSTSEPIYGTAAGIKYFTVTPATECPIQTIQADKVASGIECVFGDDILNQCGVVDRTESGKHRWIRSAKSNAGAATNQTDYRMKLLLGIKDQTSILSTPILADVANKCVSFGYRIDFGGNITSQRHTSPITYNLNLRLLTVNANGVAKVLRSQSMNEDMELWKKELPGGTQRVVIEVTTQADLQTFDPDQLYHLQLDDVNIVDCSVIEPVGISCQFSNVFACGYIVDEQFTSYNGTGLGMNAYFQEASAWLISRLYQSPSARVLTLSYYGNMNGYIKVYVMNVGIRNELHTLGPSKSDENNTETKSICLPKGKFNFAIFVHLKEGGHMILNRIHLTENSCNSVAKESDPSVLSCDFTGKSLCNYLPMIDGTDTTWENEYALGSMSESFEYPPHSTATFVAAVLRGHTATSAFLLSPIIATNKSVCVTMRYNSPGTLSVAVHKTEPVKFNTVSEVVFYQEELSGQDEVSRWNTIQFYIDASGFIEYQIGLTINGSAHSIKPSLLLDSITVMHDSRCEVSGISSTVSCSFDPARVEKCGLIDNSRGLDRWLRQAAEPGSQNVYMETSLTDLQSMSILESPIFMFAINKPVACVAIKYSRDSDNTRILALVEDQDGKTLLEVEITTDCEREGMNWTTIGIYIPDTSRRLKIVSTMKMFNYKGGVARVDNIIVIDDKKRCESTCHMEAKMASPNAINITKPTSNVTKSPSLDRMKPLSVSAGFAEVLKQHGGRGMDSLWTDLRHKEQDMILECYWEGRPCDEQIDITRTNTHVGPCLSFNKKQNLQTKFTGAEKGLRFLINIEEYDHTEFYSTDSGIRVHTHSTKDVPNIGDLGFAVAPGTHTLVGMTYTETESLPTPYGQCDEKKLEYFQNDYSKLKCTEECKARWVNEECSCVGPQFPGDFTVCDLTEHFICKNKTKGYTAPDKVIEDCKCTDNCTIIGYQLELSNSMISSISAEKLLDKHLNATTSRFTESNELRDRIAEGKLRLTIDSLESVLEIHSAFENYIRINMTMVASSIPRRVLASMVVLNNVLLEDVKYELFKDIQQIDAAYRKVKAPSLNYHKQSLKEVETSMAIYLDAFLVNSQESPIDFIKIPALKRVKNAIREQGYHSLMQSLNYSIDIQLADLIPKEHYIFGREINSSCSNIDEVLSQLFSSISECLPEVPSTLEATIPISKDACAYSNNSVWEDDITQCLNQSARPSFFGCAQHLIDMTRQKLDCISIYGYYLDDLNAWLDGLTLSWDIIEPFVEENLNTLAAHRKLLVQVRDDYYLGRISKAELSHLIASSTVRSIPQDIDTIYSVILQEFTQPTVTLIKEKSDGLIQRMERVFDEMATLVYFLTGSAAMAQRLEATARSAKIWLYPEPNLGNPREFTFRYTTDQLSNIWPQDMSIHPFVSSQTASLIIEQTITEFYHVLKEEITSLETDIRQLKDTLEDRFSMLDETATNSISENKMDANFLRQNFLRVDIYYGELKYEKITQQKGYDVVSFFSDVGGYMGLLLGCSLITIFEFLDLIIYNLLIKCVEKREGRRVSTK